MFPFAGKFSSDIDQTICWTRKPWFEAVDERFPGLLTASGLSIDEAIARHYYAHKVPAWGRPEIVAYALWIFEQSSFYERLPVIPGAVETMNWLADNDRLASPGYVTARPSASKEATVEWLARNGFPSIPLVTKADGIPPANNNIWKARTLHNLHAYSNVRGIIDDDARLHQQLSAIGYRGTHIVFGHEPFEADGVEAYRCEDWPAVKELFSRKE
jgi:hypothetical protein